MTKQPIHGLTNAQLVERGRELLPRGHGVARRIHRQVMLEGRFERCERSYFLSRFFLPR